jgi:2-polyprenyl-6-methoxyphenol hydroxylase-like FAD-dependent oxidoreductase/phytoene/squalene synthetase
MTHHDDSFSDTPIGDRYDVAIVGGGPVGCVTAAALARAGASVLVLEADPKMATRLAGEWLHPPALEVLDRLRLGRLDGARAQTGYGFSIFPDDGSPAIEMPYPTGTGAGAEHARIVASLRAAVSRVAGVSIVVRAKVTALDLSGSDAVVRIERKDGRVHDVRAASVVGADGNVSMVRTALGFPDASTLVSTMAGVELAMPTAGATQGSLPREGFGHVVLGGPGPALFYRIDETYVRGCLEVPLADRATARAPYLWERYGRVVPEVMREPLRVALEERPILWAGIKFRPRAFFGREGLVPVALVGDACGRTHPMTAIGMTQGFLDAEALAASGFATRQRGWLARYGHERGAAIPEILSNALYHCFRRNDPAATEVRRAMFKTLRESPKERARTMQILGVQDLHKRSFSSAFMRIALKAMKSTVATTASEGRLSDLPGRLLAFGEWMQWPTAAVVPGRVSSLYRAETTSETAIPLFRSLSLASSETRASSTRPAPRTAVIGSPTERERAALERANARLLSDIEAVARRLGTVPDAELAGPSLTIMRAITASAMRPGMAARMTLGRRRLATEGVARALRAETDTRTLAGLVLVLFDGVAWAEERVADLDVALTTLLASEHAGGGFSNRRGETPDLETSALVLEALAALAGRVEGAEPRALAAVRVRAATWLETQLSGTTDLSARSAAARIAASCGVGAESLHAQLTDALTKSIAPDDLALGLQVHGLAVLGAARSPLAEALTARLAGELPSRWDVLAPMSIALARHVSRPEARAAAPATARREIASVEPASAQSASEQSASEQSASAQPASEQSASAQPASAQPASAQPASAQPASAQPASAQPASAQPASGQRSLPMDASDWAFCKDALEAVSRTFSQPIAFLPEELRIAVTLGYLLCRIADTIEDHPVVAAEDKPELFARFLTFIEASASAPTGATLETSALVALFSAIRGPEADAELALARRIDVVSRVLMTLRPAVREILARWVSEMARGMDLYTRRRPGADGWSALHTVEDLDRYCYYVAGTVGHLLTDLFVEAIGAAPGSPLELALREDAESFAEGLQMVNILKDVTDDRERLVSFVPRTSVAREGLEIATLTDPLVRARAHAAVAPLFDRAEAHLDRALRYALTIPREESGMRMFCLLPLFMAVRTLVVARGNDAMFVPGAPVKISREEVAAIIADCLRFSGDDEALRARYEALRAREPAPRLRAQA